MGNHELKCISSVKMQIIETQKDFDERNTDGSKQIVLVQQQLEAKTLQFESLSLKLEELNKLFETKTQENVDLQEELNSGFNTFFLLYVSNFERFKNNSKLTGQIILELEIKILFDLKKYYKVLFVGFIFLQ